MCKELLRISANTCVPKVHPVDRRPTVNDQLGTLQVQPSRTLYPRTRYIIHHFLILVSLSLLGRQFLDAGFEAF